MRGMIAIAGLVAVTVAACDRPIPIALNAPPTPYPAQYPQPAQYPPPTAAQYQPPTAATMPAPAPQPPPKKANWKRIEADNGAAYAVDLNSIAHRNNGTAEMQVCIVDNNTCPIMPGTWNPTIFEFDCHGHYADVQNGGGLQMAPPRSVVGQMAALACVGAKDTRFADDSENAKTVRRPLPTDYCAGFAPDACDRIKNVVEAYTPSEAPPPYCKPGFALVGSGLTSEQLRICYVITGFRRETQDARPQTLVTASATPTPLKPGEKVIGQWSGKGNAKSNEFHVGPGPWDFRVKSSDSISGGIYRVSDKTGVYNFGYTDGEQNSQQTSSGDVYFVVKSTGAWTVTVVSLTGARASQ